MDVARAPDPIAVRRTASSRIAAAEPRLQEVAPPILKSTFSSLACKGFHHSDPMMVAKNRGG
jgi:hypothetical protein